MSDAVVIYALAIALHVIAGVWTWAWYRLYKSLK